MLTTTKPKACKNCRTMFAPRSSTARVCSPMCAIELGAKAKQKKALADAKVERAVSKTRKAAIKRIPDLIKEAQHAFNAYIRTRDAGKPCICCGLPLGAGEVGGAYDCGHFRSTGSASHLRFDERNAHAQRKRCNRYGAGRAVDYRIGLVARCGIEVVEALECSNSPHKWTREELIEIKTRYRAKTKALNQGEQA